MVSPYKKFILIFSSILAAAVASFLYFGRERDYAIVNQGSSGTAIIAFGDSLVTGGGSSAGNDWVTLVSDRIGRPIINAGRAGDTTSSAIGRLEQDVLSKDPKIVLVLLGGNDYLRRIRKEEIFGNLATIIRHIQDAGAAVILVEVRGRLIVGNYGEEFEKLAREHGALLVPDVMKGIMGRSDFMADSIHPNDAGYAIMAERIYPAVVQLLE